jgi:hypothetical protein
MSHSNRDEDLPLHNEAQARGKWRGETTVLKQEDNSIRLPTSEVDDAATGSRGGGDFRPGSGRPGDFPPSD